MNVWKMLRIFVFKKCPAAIFLCKAHNPTGTTSNRHRLKVQIKILKHFINDTYKLEDVK